MTTLALIGKGRWGSRYLAIIAEMKSCVVKYVKTTDYKDLHNYKDIDGIIIASPVDTHAEIANEFPDKYLLVEKPLTTSFIDAWGLTNEKIMVGHTYLYNQRLQNRIASLDTVRCLDFKLQNTSSHNSKSTPLWELAPHGVSLCVDLFGMPINVSGFKHKQGIFVYLDYLEGRCSIEVGWDYPERKVEIVFNEGELVFDGLLKEPVSPLESQIQAFVDFIKGKPCKSGLKHGVQVVEVLQNIKLCMM